MHLIFWGIPNRFLTEENYVPILTISYWFLRFRDQLFMCTSTTYDFISSIACYFVLFETKAKGQYPFSLGHADMALERINSCLI